MSEAALLSQKLQRFGVLGAGILPDTSGILQAAEAKQRGGDRPGPTSAPLLVPTSSALVAAAPAQPGTPKASTEELAAKRADIAARVAAERERRAAVETRLAAEKQAKIDAVEASREAKAVQDGSVHLRRPQILEILEETARVQGIVQQEISQLARQLAKQKGESKRRKRPMTFQEGHKKIVELSLPKEPLEDYNLTETKFQRILSEYEEDDEVMGAAQRLLHPVGKGDQLRAKRMTIDQIIEIHQFMVAEMDKVLTEFLVLSQEERRTYSGKECETTAELLVSIAVEEKKAVRCEDVEQAVMIYEEQLHNNPDFNRCTEQLAQMMQHLIGASQPRVEKAEFLRIINHMADSTQKGKAFAKKLYEDYRTKSCSIDEAYNRFEKFTEEVTMEEPEDLPDMSNVELQLCFDEYKESEEVRIAWDRSGAEGNCLMQSMMMAGMAGGPRPSQQALDDRKGKKSKPNELVDMQELMVDQLQKITNLVEASIKGGNSPGWKGEVAVQMVQALASAAVERRYGVSPEDMTLAGFQHVAALQQNPRFVRATEKQQEILMRIPNLCHNSSQVDSVE